MIWKIAAGVVAALAAFAAWRYTSVGRGARARDNSLLERLDPLAQRFEEKASVSAEEIRSISVSPELRPMLYAMLVHYEAAELIDWYVGIRKWN